MISIRLRIAKTAIPNDNLSSISYGRQHGRNWGTARPKPTKIIIAALSVVYSRGQGGIFSLLSANEAFSQIPPPSLPSFKAGCQRGFQKVWPALLAQNPTIGGPKKPVLGREKQIRLAMLCCDKCHLFALLHACLKSGVQCGVGKSVQSGHPGSKHTCKGWGSPEPGF